MNVRKIKMLHRKSWFGKLVRFPFKLIPSAAVIPILSGPLRGKLWIKGSHNISVLLGTYERIQSAEFTLRAADSVVFWDLGAHVGYYTMLFRQANKTGNIIAFEPVMENVRFFEMHMKKNRISHYSLFRKGVSNRSGTLSFDSGRTTVAGRISDSGSTAIDVVTLSSLLDQGEVPIPQLIKMDIEGEEYKVLQDIFPMLKRYRPQIFLSTHSQQLHQQCLDLLKSIDYTFKPLDSPDLVMSREVLAY